MSDQPIPAATLVLVRERQRGAPEILMVERAAGMAFAGGALVFPGGRIDEADRRLGERLGFKDGGAAVAAARETLEETAIPAALDPVPSPDASLHMQKALLSGRDFGGLLGETGTRIHRAALVPFARWVPKFHATRRFDTLFLLASAPPGEWEPNPIEGECSGAFWLSAAEVLERERIGSAKLIFPTRRNLERLALHDSFCAMETDAAAHPIDPITPWVEEVDGERFITIPSDLGYPVTREKLEGLWRG
jgi:8-oxo-dGTP pyrophosphatase MutT (NUDIX family)